MHYEVKDVFLLCENDVDGKICHFSQRKHFFLLVALPRGTKTHNIRIKKVAQFNLATFCMFRFFQNLAGFGRKPEKVTNPTCFRFAVGQRKSRHSFSVDKSPSMFISVPKARTNLVQTPGKSPAPTIMRLKFPEPSCLQERKYQILLKILLMSSVDRKRNENIT